MILLPPSLQYWEYRSRLPHPVYIVLGIECRASCTTLPTVIPSTYLQTCINLVASENSGHLQNLKENHSFEVVGAAYIRLGRLRASESQWQVRPQSVIVSSIVIFSLATQFYWLLFFGLEEDPFPSMPLDYSLSVGCYDSPVTISARTKKTSLQACPAFPSLSLSFWQLSTGLLGILLNGITVKTRNYVCYGV